jgi:hypothetical protein
MGGGLSRRWMKRGRFLTLRRILRAVKPLRVDELLYAMPSAQAKVLPEASCLITKEEPQRRSWGLSPVRQCYSVFIDGREVHSSWLNWSARLPRQFGFDREAPVIEDCSTAEPFRGRGLYPQVLQHIAKEVAVTTKVRSIYVLVSPDNQASIRGIEKVGFKQEARLRGLRIAGIMVLKQVSRNRS